VIDRSVEGDTHFPPLDERDWHELARNEVGELSFRTLVRRTSASPAP
jgi:hypothetical protein